MDELISKRSKDLKSNEANLEAELAIKDEIHRFNLEFAELSVTMRELVGAIYIRGALDALKRIKEETLENNT